MRLLGAMDRLIFTLVVRDMATVILPTTAIAITTNGITGITIVRIIVLTSEIIIGPIEVIHITGNDITIAAMIITGIIRDLGSIVSGADEQIVI